jgi:acetylglutamate kinase
MIRVIKIGGRAQSDPALASTIAAACTAGTSLTLVHGGGDEVTALQRALGQTPRFVDGRRATPPEELDVVRMVLSGTVNKRLVGQILAAGARAVGISGEDAGLLQCVVFGDGSLGAVGEPRHVEPSVLTVLMEGGFIPVISPLGRFADGSGCNVNGDDAASAIAAALGADELLLVADVAGVLDARGERTPHLDRSDADSMIASGTATGGMIAKLEAALRALEMGVRRVRIGNLDAIADPNAGTTITAPVPAASR